MRLIKQAAACVVLAGSLAYGTSAFAAAYFLNGIGSNNDYGFGSHGLYLGDNFNVDNLNNGFTNWAWNDVILDVDTGTGMATISGDMTRLENDNVWGLDIILSSMIVNDDGNLEWGNLSMTLTAPSGYSGVVPTDGWIGYEGDFDHVASLEFNDDGSVRFDAWYQNPDNAGGFYTFGDSKAIGQPVPVPAAAWLMFSALGALGFMRRRRL